MSTALAFGVSGCTLPIALTAPPAAPPTVTVTQPAPPAPSASTGSSGSAGPAYRLPHRDPCPDLHREGAHAPACDGPGAEEFTQEWIRFSEACYRRQISEPTCDAFDAATADRLGWEVPYTSYGGGQTSTPTYSSGSSSYSLSAGAMSWLSSNWPTLYDALAEGDAAAAREAITDYGPDPAYQA